MTLLDVPYKYVFSTGTILLLVLVVLARDINKPAYQSWDGLLSDIHLLSYNLDADLLAIRSGLSANYDDITESSRNIATLLSTLVYEVDTHSSAEIIEGLVPQRAISPPFSLDTTLLQKLLDERMEHIEQFKSEYAIYKNSNNILFELIENLRDTASPYPNWREELSKIELIARRGNSYSEDGVVAAALPLVNKLMRTNLTTQQNETLKFISLHIRNIEKYLPRVHRLISEEVLAASKIDSTITDLKRDLLSRYTASSRFTRRCSLAIIALASFMVVYGSIQARRALRFSDMAREHNKTLEKRVGQRTEELNLLLRKLQKETDEKQKIIENLKIKDRELQTRETFFRSITETATDPIILTDSQGFITFANTATFEVFEKPTERIVDTQLSHFIPSIDKVSALLDDRKTEVEVISESGKSLSMSYSVNKIDLDEKGCFYAAIFHDMTGFRQMEADLAHAQKLESVGQLAAGIAHEINTPAQFISDNLVFLNETIADIFKLLDEINKTASDESEKGDIENIRKLISETDIEYLSGEIPNALAQSLDGMNRVATIVRAMKDYSHPGEGLLFSDLNAAINSTITVSSGEWKYFAKLETNFEDSLPMVECIVSDINQVVLNMIVNAAHSIVEKYDDAENLQGLIKVGTCSRGSDVVIEISDNGKGIPDAVRSKIFDPFFTTKAVGKGTGQGLSIAYNIICGKHNGGLEVTSVEGEGTTFEIRLPIRQPKQMIGGSRSEGIDRVPDAV